MKEQLITFETAKLAKEKGFNEYCRVGYTEKGESDSFAFNEARKNEHLNKDVLDRKDFVCVAPTQSLLQKWLRDIHNIHVNVSPMHLSEGWRQQAYNMEKGHYKGASAGFHFKTYEEALEIGLQGALKLIKL